MSEFKHKYSLGQNFLKDKNVLMNIIDCVDVCPSDLIIEIGPGQGALTKYLKLFNSKLICFEIDLRLKKYLDKYEDNNTSIVYNDFLKVDLLDSLESVEYDNLFIIANLPYYITTPIIEKIIDSKVNVKAMVFMVQNDVADRLSAIPGCRDYGTMTVLLNYYYDIKKEFFVSRKCFDPVPNVDSAVIKLENKTSVIKVNDEKIFIKLVKDAFKMKRKNLKNNLKDYDLNLINCILKKYNLNLQDRAEDVCLECFIEIANCLSK